MGMPATGKSFRVGGASIWEVRGGQLISEWVSWDSMSMLRQLGVGGSSSARFLIEQAGAPAIPRGACGNPDRRGRDQPAKSR